MGEITKRCPSCGRPRPLTDFPRNRATATGLATYCKPCHNAIMKAAAQRLYGGSRPYLLGLRYGIRESDVQEMLTAQEGLCPVCRTRPPEHVDHDHETGRVRGILCFACNGALGQFEENLEWLARALAYLEERETGESAR